MGEHERRRVEGRVGAPPPSPVGVVLPARRTELPRTHDLGADPRLVLLGECIVGARAAAGTTHYRRTEARGEHPLVQPLSGMPDGRVRALALTGDEATTRALSLRTELLGTIRSWPRPTATGGSRGRRSTCSASSWCESPTERGARVGSTIIARSARRSWPRPVKWCMRAGVILA